MFLLGQISGGQRDACRGDKGTGLPSPCPLPEAEDGENQRRFALIGTFHYTDGTTKEFVASFNPDTNAGQSWQYTAQVMVAEKAYNSITVAIAYDYNVNTVYFDGIQLYKEQFGSSYTYDEDGNVISVVDLQKQKTEYEYTDNDLTKAILPTGAELTYTYDDYHNVKTATTEEGLVYSFVYDTYGNNTSVSVTDNTTTVTSSATYTADGNRMVTATNSLGKVTTYEYDPDTNVLNWVKYPNDTDDTKTVYTYDEMYRAATIAATTDTELDMSVKYTYTDDYLTKVKTPTTTYDFTYGNFGLRTSVKIGDRTLASYRYTDDRNFYMAGLDYGNGDKVEYTYDEKGRLTCQTYEDGDTVTYQYDNDGALAAMTDSATGRTTRYFYDNTGRVTKYTETGTDYSHSVTYSYDTSNNLTTQTEIINGVTHTTSYTYDTDNRVTSKTTDGVTVEYTYDTLGRITQQVTKNGDTTVKTETYTFTPNSTQVATYRTQIGSYDVTYSYTYDDNGNILTANEGTNSTTTYQYDSQNQLIREDNQYDGSISIMSYDNAGNILAKTVYLYTTGELGQPIFTRNYTYGDEWGDLLTAYMGTDITYDEIGNPLSYRGMQFTWEHGRELTTIQQGSTTGTYTYDADGMRTGRTYGNSSYKYIYNGSQLVRMEYTNGSTTAVMEFAYDAQGTPLTLTCNNEVYYYVTNLQGDVVNIVNANGTPCAKYGYDAWGNCLSFYNSIVGQLNPLRYRGYVYDAETSLYYLQSRYYDPYTGRFLNADAFASTGQGLTGNNMFAYCGNNPVNRCDPTGAFFIELLEKVFGKINEAVSQVKAILAGPSGEYITDQNDSAIRDFNVGLSNVGDAGCAIVASYNALITLGNPKPFRAVLKSFNSDHLGRSAGGLLGFYPFAVENYFRREGYRVVGTNNRSKIYSHSQTADACIMYYMYTSTTTIASIPNVAKITMTLPYAHFFHYKNLAGTYYGYNDGPNTSFTDPYVYGMSGSRIYAYCIFIYK